jgi:hypothetical protein
MVWKENRKTNIKLTVNNSAHMNANLVVSANLGHKLSVNTIISKYQTHNTIQIHIHITTRSKGS